MFSSITPLIALALGLVSAALGYVAHAKFAKLKPSTKAEALKLLAEGYAEVSKMPGASELLTAATLAAQQEAVALAHLQAQVSANAPATPPAVTPGS